MNEQSGGRLGRLIYFSVAAIFLVVAIGFFVWALMAQPGADDQSDRATLGGLAVGVISLMFSVLSAVLGLKSDGQRTVKSSGPRLGNVVGGQQVISDYGTGYMGGNHFNGDSGQGDRR
ncbi:MAG: hypothetical protein V7738_09940 [Dietzia maris]